MVKDLEQTESEKSIDFLECIKKGDSIGELAHRFNMDYVEVRRILHLNPEYIQYQKQLRNTKRDALKEKRIAVAQKYY